MVVLVLDLNLPRLTRSSALRSATESHFVVRNEMESSFTGRSEAPCVSLCAVPTFGTKQNGMGGNKPFGKLVWRPQDLPRISSDRLGAVKMMKVI